MGTFPFADNFLNVIHAHLMVEHHHDQDFINEIMYEQDEYIHHLRLAGWCEEAIVQELNDIMMDKERWILA